ncbi:hypothetical protein ABIA39_006981 [Nocardia sp. GAS34]
MVGQLARRHAIVVSLQESAYCGIKAIVLIPNGLLDPGTLAEEVDQAIVVRAETHAMATPVRSVSDPVPRLGTACCECLFEDVCDP